MDLTKLDLNLLVYLDALLTQCHVTNASKQVGLSQSAMSRALSRLREAFQDPLLQKTLHGMERTPLGVQLMPEVQALLAQVERTLAIGHRDQFDPTHDLRRWSLGADACCMRLFLPELTLRLRQHAPKTQLACETGDPLLQAWRASRQEIDLILTSELGSVSRGESVVQELGQDHLVAVGSKALGGGVHGLTREDFIKRPHLVWISHPSHVEQVDVALWEGGQKREIFLICDDLEFALAMLEQNRDMLLVLPKRLAQLVVELRGTLEFSQIPLPLVPISYRALWQGERDAGAVWLSEQLDRLVQGMG